MFFLLLMLFILILLLIKRLGVDLRRTVRSGGYDILQILKVNHVWSNLFKTEHLKNLIVVFLYLVEVLSKYALFFSLFFRLPKSIRRGPQDIIRLVVQFQLVTVLRPISLLIYFDLSPNINFLPKDLFSLF